MVNLLITGGAGYIGTVISGLALKRGYRVKVVDLLWFKKDVPLTYSTNQNYEFIEADICNRTLMEQILEGVDFIVHAAAVVGEPATKKFPELTRRVNYQASVDLINMAREKGIKGFIFFSTCSNYGISEGLANEDTLLKPPSLYAQTKVDVERYLMEKADGLDWVICRLSTAYGVSPRMRFDLTVNDFTMNAVTKKYIDIYLPYTYRPYMHIFDIAEVILKTVDKFEAVKNNIFNVGFNKENYQKIQIAEIIKKFIPDLRIEVTSKGTDIRDYQVDFSKLNKWFGATNTYTVEYGVREVIDLLNQGVITDPLDEIYYNTYPKIGG